MAVTLTSLKVVANPSDPDVPASGTYPAVGPTDDWQTLIRLHDGPGEIVLKDGTYTFSGIVQPRGRRLIIRAQNVGGATIVGRWEPCGGAQVLLSGLNLKPPVGERFMRVDNSIMEFDDCAVDLRQGASDTMCHVINSSLHVTATTRNATWTGGDSASVQMFDVDSASNVKLVGNKGAYRVRFSVTNNVAIFVLDASKALFGGAYFQGGGKTIGAGVRLRRVSTLMLSDDNRFFDLDLGAVSEYSSILHVYQAKFQNCGTGLLSKSMGAIRTSSRSTGLVVFSGNDTDIDNQATVNTDDVGG